MKFLKKVKPTTWVTAAILVFVLAVGAALFGPTIVSQLQKQALASAEATIGYITTKMPIAN